VSAGQVVAHEIGAALLAAWLVIGATAGYQHHYYSSDAAICAKARTIPVTILGGPLSYFGMNPKISCIAPKPSQ
jgi:hypothetical protein